MRESFLKTSVTHVTETVDPETAEISTQVNHVKYLANSKEEFWLGYSALILFLKHSKDVRVKLLAALIERYSAGQEFGLGKGMKEILAKELSCSPRSFDLAITELVEEHILVRIGTSLYILNPRHVFRGSRSERNGALKATLELYCPDC